MIVGLIFKFRGACIYTWVNVNLNFAEWNDLMFPQIHIFLFTEENISMYPPLPIPLSTLQPIYDHPFVISHFANYNTHDIMCKYIYNKITNQ